MWVSRFLLHRCAEEFKLSVSFEPKLFPDWNGSGCHANFSTETMRLGTGGMKYIEDMMEKFYNVGLMDDYEGSGGEFCPFDYGNLNIEDSD